MGESVKKPQTLVQRQLIGFNIGRLWRQVQIPIPMAALKSTSGLNIVRALDVHLSAGSPSGIDIIKAGMHVVLFLNPDNASSNVAVAAHQMAESESLNEDMRTRPPDAQVPGVHLCAVHWCSVHQLHLCSKSQFDSFGPEYAGSLMRCMHFFRDKDYESRIVKRIKSVIEHHLEIDSVAQHDIDEARCKVQSSALDFLLRAANIPNTQESR